MNTAEEILQLTLNLRRYNEAYFNEHISLVSDAEYDTLFARLTLLEQRFPQFKQDHSPTTAVGARVNSAKVKHLSRMLSLANVFYDTAAAHAEFIQFLTRTARAIAADVAVVEYVASPKYDGVAVSLIYEGNQLVRAVTRGDGEYGEDVTHNIKAIADIPMIIAGDQTAVYDIRGELIIMKADFAALNAQQLAAGDKLYANARNLASGSIRQLIPSYTNSLLHFFAYSCSIVTNNFQHQLDFYAELTLLKYLGFAVADNCRLLSGINNLINYYDVMLQVRSQLPYNIDGVVYRINNLTYQAQLGFTARTPKFATAYKFAALQADTQLISITLQVGRTGIITPVAQIDPVVIDGSTISQATLHNHTYIASHDIRVGDRVIVKRAGDVIPKIVGVAPNSRHTALEPFAMPSLCPSCGTQLQFQANATICIATGSCLAQQEQSLIHFCSKHAFNIAGLGTKVMQQLLSHQLITNSADIFRLTKTHLLQLDHIADKSANNLIAAIQHSKNISCTRFIYALGIPHVGRTLAQTLASTVTNITQLYDYDIASLQAINTVGTIIAQSVVDFFTQPIHVTLVEDLIQLGVIIEYSNTNKPERLGKLAQQTIVITGTFMHYRREELITLLIQEGARVVNTVTTKTTMLIMGNAPGSKLTKAQHFNITILDEDGLMTLLR